MSENLSQLLVREFDDLHWRVADDGDGCTVEALVVPYGREIDAVDITPRGVVRYREVFEPGSNERAVRAPNRTVLTYTHDESLPQRLGYGLEFRESGEGLHGVFRLDASTAAKARDVLTSTHRAISAGFASINPRHGTEQPGTLVRRLAVALLHVAAVPEGQYADARVLAVREHQLAAALAEEDRLVAAQARAEHEQWMVKIDEILASQRAMAERFAEPAR